MLSDVLQTILCLLFEVPCFYPSRGGAQLVRVHNPRADHGLQSDSCFRRRLSGQQADKEANHRVPERLLYSRLSCGIGDEDVCLWRERVLRIGLALVGFHYRWGKLAIAFFKYL